MDNNIFNLLLTLVTITIAVIGTYLVSLIKHKIGSDKANNYFNIAKQVVMFIEQFNPDLSNIDKKELAVSKLVELTNNEMTHEQAEILIEAAVYEIKKIIK